MCRPLGIEAYFDKLRNSRLGIRNRTQLTAYSGTQAQTSVVWCFGPGPKFVQG